jgi:hypothetical protein
MAARLSVSIAALGALLAGCSEAGAFDLPLIASPVTSLLENEEPLDPQAVIPRLVKGKVVLPNALNEGGGSDGRWFLAADATPFSGTVLNASDSSGGTQMRDGYRNGFSWQSGEESFSIVPWKDGNVDGWARQDSYYGNPTSVSSWRAYVKDGHVLQYIAWSETRIDSMTYDPVSGTGTFVEVNRCAPNASGADAASCTPGARTERTFQRNPVEARFYVLAPVDSGDLASNLDFVRERRARTIARTGHFEAMVALRFVLRDLGLR